MIMDCINLLRNCEKTTCPAFISNFELCHAHYFCVLGLHLRCRIFGNEWNVCLSELELARAHTHTQSLHCLTCCRWNLCHNRRANLSVVDSTRLAIWSQADKGGSRLSGGGVGDGAGLHLDMKNGQTYGVLVGFVDVEADAKQPNAGQKYQQPKLAPYHSRILSGRRACTLRSSCIVCLLKRLYVAPIFSQSQFESPWLRRISTRPHVCSRWVADKI